MRVLTVTHYFPEHGGGIELAAGQIATRILTRGAKVEWIASGEDLTTGFPNAIPVRAWNAAEKVLGVPYPLWSLSGLKSLREAVRRSDLIHVHDSLYIGSISAAWAARRLDRPLIVTQHVGFVPFHNPVLRAGMHVANRSVAQSVLSRAQAVVYCSKTTAAYFAAALRGADRVAFVPNGVDRELFTPLSQGSRADLRAALGLPSDRPVFLFVGRFVEKKGLKVLRELVRRVPKPLWVFAGWGPDDPSTWGRTELVSLGRQSQSQLAEWYRAADLLVLPSVGEGFPLVVQEAMACGTPAALSTETARAYPGVEQLAWHADPTVPGFKELLTEVLADPLALERRRAQVAAFAAAEWDWDTCADRYLEIYQRVLRDHRR
jgi:glycosyltransferase involved in cell wall biosynthesis